MSGYCYGEPEPIVTCPWCGFDDCRAEYVDIGVGNQQVTPFVCERCHAVQIGPFDEKPVSAEESEKGWYYPDPARWPVFVHVTPKCEHTFTGWREFEDGRGGEQVCSKCGLGAMAWSLRTGL